MKDVVYVNETSYGEKSPILSNQAQTSWQVAGQYPETESLYQPRTTYPEQSNLSGWLNHKNDIRGRSEITTSKKNGETISQMRHAFNLASTQEDCSKDMPWSQDFSLAITDRYCIITSYFFFFTKTLIFVVPLILCSLPITFAAWLYGISLPTPTDRVCRTCGFWTYWGVLLPFAIPFIFLSIVAFCFDCIFYYIFSVPWFFVRLCIEEDVGLKSSYKYLRRYRNGPWVFCYLTDILVVMIGQTLRQGFWECTGKLAFMVILVPWIKYYINTNPWLYQLEERFVQQITTSMKDMEMFKVANACRDIISQAKQPDGIQDAQDRWSFAPHYPYPPIGRNWCLGFQAAGNSAVGMFLIVHTTHALKRRKMEKKDPHYFILSNTVRLPIYRVMLWYNNPYHIFTGYVEASISTGGMYQRDKINGGEHPMWLLTSRSPMLSGRNSSFGVGWIDNFFDYWLPFFVFEIRKIVRGLNHAKKYHEQVISQDGISRPAGKIDFVQNQ